MKVHSTNIPHWMCIIYIGLLIGIDIILYVGSWLEPKFLCISVHLYGVTQFHDYLEYHGENVKVLLKVL